MSGEAQKRNLTAGKMVSYAWNKLGVWLVFIILFILLAFANEKFLLPANLINVVRQICVNAVVALGATYVVLCGEIDLSQSSLAVLAGCGCAMLIMKAGMNIYLAMVISLAAGTVVGALMGLIVTKLRVQSFIATLGMQYALAGVVLLLTNSQPITGLPDSFAVFGRGYVGPIPVPSIILVVVFLIGAFVLKYTAFGRNVLAVGENPTAANLSGINVHRTKIAVFAIAGLMSAMGGLLLTARLSSGQPSSGSDLSLQALAAVFVGGASRGSVMNTLAGALIMGLINNGLNLMEVNAYWQKVALGFIIVGAVALDMFRSSHSGSKQ
ncbi:ABC transporter permease [uncultured Anaerotruncus sp.]|uniref:ABC transporter permease n=1 Tax=uncultured Anaerotruncus sp. TaxID=905011 RepID=UPI00280BF51A|nr:ABC transporter permease [uncultured Anaerotruncus sp.]